MTIELNHTIVWCRDQKRSAAFLTEILGRPPATRFGPFLVVRTVEPVVTPKAFLYDAARTMLVGQQLGIGDADVNVRTAVLAERERSGYGPSLRSRSSNSR